MAHSLAPFLIEMHEIWTYLCWKIKLNYGRVLFFVFRQRRAEVLKDMHLLWTKLFFIKKNIFILFHYFSNGYTLKNQSVDASGIFSEGTTLRRS